MRAIPEGYLGTYGDVSPGAPRFAGTVLFGADEPDLPWWRVIPADGRLYRSHAPIQAPLLAAEGHHIDDDTRRIRSS